MINWKSFFCRHKMIYHETTSGDMNNLYPSRTIVQCVKCRMLDDAIPHGFPTSFGINKLIKECGNSGAVSDGYHTFNELYEHRIMLFCALVGAHKEHAWKARANFDGSRWDGWFILGLFPENGKQITYHLPERYWHRISGIPEFEVNPYYDGHTSEDILTRLKNL